MAGSVRMCSYETAILLDYTSPAVDDVYAHHQVLLHSANQERGKSLAVLLMEMLWNASAVDSVGSCQV